MNGRRKIEILLLQLFCIYLCTISSQSLQPQKGYLTLAPAIFRSGVDQTITVRIFQQIEPVLVKATIVDAREKSTITSAVSEIRGNGKITLKIPKGVEGKATLQICGNCHQHATFRFQNSTIITIVNKGTSAFIQTDKPVYKPSQRVYINIYTVDRDLRPVSDNVTVYAKAPNDVKIIEWRDLQPACSGTITVSFPLSDQPPLGEWKLFAELQGNLYNTTFEVGKYVLPKFDVIITPPSSFRDFSICEEALVTARYAFGKPVIGTLTVNMTITGSGYFTKDLHRGATTVQKMKFHGESKFAICLQHNLRREHLTTHFRGTLAIRATVTSEDGSQFSAFDDTTIVSRNFVELKFTTGTRKNFKPGIPFYGQIFASYLNGTGAENILVELKVEDSQETFMTQNLLSLEDGSIPFMVPALPHSTKFIWLEARVIAIDGTYTQRSQYLAVYHILHSWHSPSKCNLLVETPSEKLMVNKPATITIKSSCACDFTLYYEFMSRGDIMLSDYFQVNESNSRNYDYRKKRSLSETAIENNGIENHICQTSIQLTPTNNMAPLAKLLAYYVRKNGEGVADSIHLPIEPILENEVTIESTKTSLSPGEDVNVTVSATEDSCVCLGATDKSLHFLSPEYLLSRDEIFDEIYTYDMDNLPFEEEESWRPNVRGKRKRRSTHDLSKVVSRDSFHAFLETGLVVMTDVVILNHKQDIQLFGKFRLQALTQASVSKVQPRKRRKLRSFFPETWYWKCFTPSKNEKTKITLKVPDTMTSWVLNAVATSPSTGIGVARNIELQTAKPFFVSFNLPYSATRGEELEVPITLHNYLDTCAEVRLVIAVPAKVTISDHDSNTERKKTKFICVASQSTAVTTFKIAFSNLGSSKILAIADAVEGPNRCCNADHKMISKWKETDETNENLLSGNVVGKDAVLRTIIVEAEGEPREDTHSVFFCPNERMNITTTPATYHFVKFPKKKQSFTFLAKAQNSVHIAFTMDETVSNSLYEIVLGGHDNTVSWIQQNDKVLMSTPTKHILSNKEFRSFWVQWSETNITLGYGMENTKVSEFLTMQIQEPINAGFIGLATSGQTAAEFRLWSTEDVEESFREIFQLDVPTYAVPGSIRGYATVIGDVMGPTLRNLNNLLKLPYGCGEQNMINFAPNIHILKYLKTTNQLTSETKTQATEYLIQGYQRQLTYKRSSGSYSAFGEHDFQGSMWLTAFVMKSFAEAKEFIYIDQQEIEQAMNWILNHQEEDGSFPAYGKILNKDVQGGINRKIALTAYVVISLLETEMSNQIKQKKSEAIGKAIDYLEGMVMFGARDPYAGALTAYALTLAKSSMANDARMVLLDWSIISDGRRHWSLKEYVEPKLSDPADMFQLLGATKQTVASAEIELASYALLAFTLAEDVSTALPIVKWISNQRNAQGGFSSTQDTCTALQALSSYGTFSYVGGVNLKVALEGPNYVWNVHLNSTNSEILQTGGIPSLAPGTIPVFLNASGDGCALLQIHVLYNIPTPDDRKEFALQVIMTEYPAKSKPSGSLSKRKRDSGEPVRPALVAPNVAAKLVLEEVPPNVPVNANTAQVVGEFAHIKICGRWLNQGSSNMAVLEVPLLTGFTADIESLNTALSNRSRSLKRYEIEHSKVIFYFDEISSLCKSCVSFKIRRDYKIENPQPKIVKLYDYYEPGYESSTEYKHFDDVSNLNCEQEGDCPSDDFDDGYPECKCFKECGYQGPRVCGNDGNAYENLCRMEVASCETDRPILQENDLHCEIPRETATLEPPLVIPTDETLYGIYDDVFDEAAFGSLSNEYIFLPYEEN